MNEYDKSFLKMIAVVFLLVFLLIASIFSFCWILSQKWPEKKIYMLEPNQMEQIIQAVKEGMHE